MATKRARNAQGLAKIETDPGHHLTGPFLPQTPIQAERPLTPPGRPRRSSSSRNKGLWHDLATMKWVIRPSSSFKMLLVPLVLYLNWKVIAPLIDPSLPNPFRPLIFISHETPESTPENPKYGKGPLDFLFVAYYVIFFSFLRQVVTINIFHRVGRFFGLRKAAKLDRVGEQGYAIVYFGVMGAWGVRIMSQLPTWWFQTEHFWLHHPEYTMTAELKRYYLMQSAYWVQQLIVLVLGLEKPRKDYYELVVHHIVTIWLIWWSYLINVTMIGNAVYLSMDIPDAMLAFSKLLNYFQYERSKTVSFAIFVGGWSYFRHWLNLRILWSVWTEWDLIPEWTRFFRPMESIWLAWWMKYMFLFFIGALQILNIFWYVLIWRILIRAIFSHLDDERSDDEDDGEETEKNPRESDDTKED